MAFHSRNTFSLNKCVKFFLTKNITKLLQMSRVFVGSLKQGKSLSGNGIYLVFTETDFTTKVSRVLHLACSTFSRVLHFYILHAICAWLLTETANFGKFFWCCSFILAFNFFYFPRWIFVNFVRLTKLLSLTQVQSLKKYRRNIF